MSIYKKLAHARVMLQEKPIKQSGHNKFAGYKYMELADFIPHINSICNEVGICGVVSFNEIATLTLVDCDNAEEKIVFTSPMAEASLKGCHPIQNLGAVHSYMRRYLWMNAFEIVEHDALDATTGSTQNNVHESPEQEAEKWIESLMKCISEDEMKAIGVKIPEHIQPLCRGAYKSRLTQLKSMEPA